MNARGNNDLLSLQGTFSRRIDPKGKPIPALRAGVSLTYDHVETLRNQLNELFEFWKKEAIIQGALINATYFDVTPKTRRISALLSSNGSADSHVVGAKFGKNQLGGACHVITYYVSKKAIEDSISLLNKALLFLSAHDRLISKEGMGSISSNLWPVGSYGIKKTKLSQTYADCSNVVSFSKPDCKKTISESSVITIYKTEFTLSDILKKIDGGVSGFNTSLSNTTGVLDPASFTKLKAFAPYLIAMSFPDFSLISPITNGQGIHNDVASIPSPKNEPIIGVFDTGFDQTSYFKEWVKVVNCLPKEIVLNDKDLEHGTSVDSIIVDGPSINPFLDDGCGRFQVRHFVVATSGKTSSSLVMEKIEETIKENANIKVWNLSLGSPESIDDDFVSPAGAILDELASKYNVLFIVAGTNDEKESKSRMGSPADSLNAIVVNSVRFSDKKPASYRRVGPVLSFFRKPDVSYYGGDYDRKIIVCSHLGRKEVVGTSFAAPWIARKAAYLIEIMKLPREVAKAMIVDSATDWDSKRDKDYYSEIGYGVVPIKIEDVIESKLDEIKFVIEGDSSIKTTYNYSLPVPNEFGRYPFIAKATMCYFPSTSREQGVDYSDTELSFSFGRMNEDLKVDSIKDAGSVKDYQRSEAYSRKEGRKWDNVKHISQIHSAALRGIEVKNNNPMWGIQIESNERVGTVHKLIHFGMVVTLKEIHGKNRIEKFVELCQGKGWIVVPLRIEEKVDIFNSLDEEIKLD